MLQQGEGQVLQSERHCALRTAERGPERQGASPGGRKEGAGGRPGDESLSAVRTAGMRGFYRGLENITLSTGAVSSSDVCTGVAFSVSHFSSGASFFLENGFSLLFFLFSFVSSFAASSIV